MSRGGYPSRLRGAVVVKDLGVCVVLENVSTANRGSVTDSVPRSNRPDARVTSTGRNVNSSNQKLQHKNLPHEVPSVRHTPHRIHIATPLLEAKGSIWFPMVAS